jgi:mRNA-degrading endonuclease RelE of RelBE toxin-antitoxin system
MRYRLEIKEEALQQLRALPKEQRRNVGRRLDALQTNLSGDVKKLTAKTREYRLRVGPLPHGKMTPKGCSAVDSLPHIQ